MSLARPAQAIPVLVSTEGLPGIDLAQRDLAGSLRYFEAEDSDADGTISAAVDLDPTTVAYHIKNGPSKSTLMYLQLNDGVTSAAPIPFLITGTNERVITNWVNLPLIPFVIGQPLSVAGGQISGLSAIIYRSPGATVFDSADDIVDLDLTTLPLYTGPLQVGGLVSFQAVPEPSTLALAAFGALGLLIAAGHQR